MSENSLQPAPAASETTSTRGISSIELTTTLIHDVVFCSRLTDEETVLIFNLNLISYIIDQGVETPEARAAQWPCPECVNGKLRYP